MDNYSNLPKDFSKIKFWEKIKLSFYPAYVSIDYTCGDDCLVAITYKIMNSKIYVLKAESINKEL